MPDHDRDVLTRFVDRLLVLEQMTTATEDRPIVEIARATLLEAIAAVSQRLRDRDLEPPQRGAAPSGPWSCHGWPAAPPDLAI